MGAIYQLRDLPVAEKVQRLSILLNCEDDDDVCYVLKRAIEVLSLFTIQELFEDAMLRVLDGRTFHFI